MAVDFVPARGAAVTAASWIGGAQDVVAALLGGVVVVAIYLDGRAHVLNLPGSFFTPWHAMLYGGVLALSGWLLVMGRASGAREGRLVRMPAGYGLALAGAVLFFLGGGADLLWHTVFGIEFGIDALLSPSHLWLFVSGALMLSGPVRAASARRAAGAPSRRGPAAAIVAVTSLAGLAAFALSYLSAYFTDAPTRPVPHFLEGTPEHAAVEIPASLGLASYLVTSLVLTAPLAWLILRWRLPFGTVTGYATGLALLAFTLMDFRRLYAVAATALAGLVVDVLLGIAQRRGVTARIRAVAAAGVLPAVAWSAQLVGMAYAEGVGWPAALVGGVVVLSALVSALAAGFLAAPVDGRDGRHQAWLRGDSRVVPGGPGGRVRQAG